MNVDDHNLNGRDIASYVEFAPMGWHVNKLHQHVPVVVVFIPDVVGRLQTR